MNDWEVDKRLRQNLRALDDEKQASNQKIAGIEGCLGGKTCIRLCFLLPLLPPSFPTPVHPSHLHIRPVLVVEKAV